MAVENQKIEILEREETPTRNTPFETFDDLAGFVDKSRSGN